MHKLPVALTVALPLRKLADSQLLKQWELIEV